MNKIDSIFRNEEGYFYDTGNSVVFILEKPSALFRIISGCAGYMLKAMDIDKKTGNETPYSLYTSNGIRTFDLEKLKGFKSFGPGENGTPLIEDLKAPRK